MVSLSQTGTATSHVVLYDHSKTVKENDECYYFKNSYLSQLWITVPKLRATTNQKRTYYECADCGETGKKFLNVVRADVGRVTSSIILDMFKKELYPLSPQFEDLNKNQNPPIWTIDDESYALMFEKV